ncbi:MAG TPA: carboxylating nicotinate-nucleotide diphosphorylase [Acidobacteriota bacterium]
MDDRLRAQLAAFLDEDLAGGDLTSEAVVAEDRSARGTVRAGAAGILAGVEECLALGEIAGVSVEARRGDGDTVAPGDVVLELTGSARAILGLERTLLNLLSHMSGVATVTRRAVDAVAACHRGGGSPQPPRIAATRKTLPGLRRLQKKAVVIGGGLPHRFDLGEAVLIKDNHLAVEPDIATAVARARQAIGTAPIEIEVETAADAVVAARAGADRLLLDNMPPAGVREVVAALQSAGLRNGRLLEASGGITMKNVCEYADTGVDWISMGMLTASPAPIDFSLHFVS